MYTKIELAPGLDVYVRTKMNIRASRVAAGLFRQLNELGQDAPAEESLEVMCKAVSMLIVRVNGDASVLDPALPDDLDSTDEQDIYEIVEHMDLDNVKDFFEQAMALMGLSPQEEEDLGNSPSD